MSTIGKNVMAKPGEKSIILQHRTNSTLIWVTFDKVGFHRYPDAPDEVAYLRERHRHIFQFRVCISVHHDDREIEFHMLKNWLMGLYDSKLEVNHKSCEMLAQDLLDQILVKYNCTNRRVVVDVSEDGECGASLISEPAHTVPISEAWLKEQYLKIATSNAMANSVEAISDSTVGAAGAASTPQGLTAIPKAVAARKAATKKK